MRMFKTTYWAVLEIVINTCMTQRLPRQYHLFTDSGRLLRSLKCTLLNLKKNEKSRASELQPSGLPPTDNILRIA